MEVQNEPTLVRMQHKGLNLGFALQDRSLTGFSLDYQKSSKSADVAEVVSMVNGVMSRKLRRSAGPLPPILEGIAGLTAAKGSAERNPTLVNVKSAGLKLDLVLREKKITGLTVDYQQVSGDGQIKEVLKVLDLICSGGKTEGLSPILGVAQGVSHAPLEEDDFEGPDGASPLKAQNQVDEMIVQSVLASLEMIGGGRQALLGLLESRYGMKLADIPEHPRGFMGILRETLGSTADVIEKGIISEIRKTAPVEGSKLQDVVRSLRNPEPLEKPVEVRYEVPPVVLEEPVPPAPTEAPPAVVSPEVAEPRVEPEEPAVMTADPMTLEEVPSVSVSFSLPAESTPEENALMTAQAMLKPKAAAKRSWFKR